MSAVIMGCGTYGQVYSYYLSQRNIDVVGFLDDNLEKKDLVFRGIPVIGTSKEIEKLTGKGVSDFYCPIGSNKTRVALNERARSSGLTTPNFIHPSSTVDSEVQENSGIYILPGSVIMPFSEIARDVMISTAVTVAHHTVLHQGVFLSTGVSVGANMVLDRNVYVGMKAVLVTGKVNLVGCDAVVGAGSVVIQNITSRAVVAGVPARMLKD